MDFTTTLTTTEDKVTWGMDADYITDLSYDPANRTIIVQFNGNSIKCRIGGYERDLAAALWKQLAKAHKAKDLVYLCAKGTWSPNQWFCGMQNHTEDYLEAEALLSEAFYSTTQEVEVNRLLP